MKIRPIVPIALGLLAVFLMNAAALSQEIATPPGMQKVFIPDPAFRMNAFEVFVPVKWHFEGTLVQGTKCKPVPYPVFRTSSPDGLTVLERLPRLDWSWGTDLRIARDQSDCLPLKQTMTAKEFLKYISATLQVEYVADDPFPADIVERANKGAAQAQAAYANKYAMNHMQAPVEKIDMARAVVRYRNGSFKMKGLLAVTLDCTQSTLAGQLHGPAWVTNTCMANIRYVHAPEEKYAAALALLDPHNTGSVELQDWSKAWMANNDQQTSRNIEQINRSGAQAIADTKARGEQFQHSQDVKQKMHEEFLSTMQRGTTMSMNRAAEIANTNHTIASDWVDYSLDRQTVRDPATGQVTKVSSANSYTWLDGSGKVSYQTNDVNANPNGVLTGNWTRQTVVHGDGSN